MFPLVALPALTTSCGTLFAVSVDVYPKSKPFRGVQWDVDALSLINDFVLCRNRNVPPSWKLWFLLPIAPVSTVLYSVDIPFSALADLVVLPFQPKPISQGSGE